MPKKIQNKFKNNSWSREFHQRKYEVDRDYLNGIKQGTKAIEYEFN